MPYRDAIESVLQRCEELRARIERIEGERVGTPEVRTLGDALAWEAALRVRLEHLDVRAAQADVDVSELEPVVRVAASEPPRGDVAKHAWRGLAVAVLLVSVAAVALGVGLAAHPSDEPGAPPLKRSYLLAGNVASPRHHGDRCTIAVDVDRGVCDLDVICPSIERRFHATTPGDGEWVSIVVRDQVELDGRRGRLTMLDEESRPLEIELDEWR